MRSRTSNSGWPVGARSCSSISLTLFGEVMRCWRRTIPSSNSRISSRSCQTSMSALFHTLRPGVDIWSLWAGATHASFCDSVATPDGRNGQLHRCLLSIMLSGTRCMVKLSSNTNHRLTVLLLLQTSDRRLFRGTLRLLSVMGATMLQPSASPASGVAVAIGATFALIC